MTPEERFEYIEAKLQSAARLLDPMSLRHAGIRGLYRKGVNRVEEMATQTAADLARLSHRLEESAEESDKHNILLAALMESQLRTEKNLSRLEQTVAENAKSISELRQTVAETSKNLSRTEQAVAESSKNLTRLEETVASLANSVQKFVDCNGKQV